MFLQRHFRNSFYQQGLFWPVIGFSEVQPNMPYQPVAIGRGGLSVGLSNPFIYDKKMGYNSKYGGEVQFLIE